MSITVTSEVTCRRADELRVKMRPISSITHYMSGKVLDPHLPPITETTWGTGDREELRERIDADGCRHWWTEYLGEEA